MISHFDVHVQGAAWDLELQIRVQPTTATAAWYWPFVDELRHSTCTASTLQGVTMTLLRMASELLKKSQKIVRELMIHDDTCNLTKKDAFFFVAVVFFVMQIFMLFGLIFAIPVHGDPPRVRGHGPTRGASSQLSADRQESQRSQLRRLISPQEIDHPWDGDGFWKGW